jgi:two-component system, LytTR family, sensor kinase
LTLTAGATSRFAVADAPPNDAPPAGDARATWTWGLGRIWTMAFALAVVAAVYFGLQLWLLDVQANGRFVPPSRATFAGTITWFVWALLAPPMVAVFRAFPVERRWSIRTVGAYAVASLAAGVVHGLIENPLWFWAVNAPPVVHYGAAVRVIWWTVLRLPTSAMQFLAFAAAYHALALARSARERELTMSRAQAALAEAELRALKARLEPHFLFNTLNAIVSYVRHSPPVAEEMLGRLSRLLRAVLQSSGDAEVSLANEIALVREYLELHRVRFGDRLTIEVAMDQDVAGVLIPTMLLQPIVENAIQHGIAARPGAGSVSIVARRLEGALIVDVTDATNAGDTSVASTTPARPLQESAGIGLAVTRARLAQHYGDASRLTLVGRPSGMTVRVELPLRQPTSAGLT